MGALLDSSLTIRFHENFVSGICPRRWRESPYFLLTICRTSFFTSLQTSFTGAYLRELLITTRAAYGDFWYLVDITTFLNLFAILNFVVFLLGFIIHVAVYKTVSVKKKKTTKMYLTLTTGLSIWWRDSVGFSMLWCRLNGLW